MSVYQARRVMVLLLLGGTLVKTSVAQGWVRASIQRPVTAAAFESQPPTGVFKWGPLVVDAGFRTAWEYSSNVLLAAEAEEGWQAEAGLRFDTTWLATEGQQLKFTGDLKYRQILSGPGESRAYLLLEPGSALRYTMYIKDVRIMPFLYYTRQIDPVAAPTVTNTATFAQISHDYGLQVDWALRQLTFQLMALQGRKTSQSEAQAKTVAERESVSLRVLRTLSPALELGVDGFYAELDYRNGPSRAGQERNASIFGRAILSPAMQVRGSVGLTAKRFEGLRQADDQRQTTAGFMQLDFTHRIRPFLSYTLRLEESNNETTTSNFYTGREVSVLPTLTLNQRDTLRLDASRLWVRESAGSGETGVRYSYGLRAERSLSGGYFLTLGGRAMDKRSTLANRAYRQTKIDVTLRKQF
jgi:hypothetical protein